MRIIAGGSWLDQKVLFRISPGTQTSIPQPILWENVVNIKVCLIRMTGMVSKRPFD